MARIRYLKPDFFKDEDLATRPLIERMTFAGLWCHADREGRLEYRPRFLKAEIWPYEDVDMENLIKNLADPQIQSRPEKAFIIIYEAEGRKYIQIIEFLKHQKPHHTERPSTIPPPNGELTVKQPLIDGDKPEGMEKGMERKMEKSNDVPPSDSPKTSKSKKRSPLDLDSEQQAYFVAFWQEYPKKVNKPTAKQAWGELRPDKGLFEKIITALKIHRETPQWKRDDGQFIPYPATWLNGRRWEDELEAQVNDTSTSPRNDVLDMLDKARSEMGVTS